MSGGGGGVIIIKSVIDTLGDPLVHGALPDEMRAKVDVLLAKDPATWDEDDKAFVGHVYTWGLSNLP